MRKTMGSTMASILVVSFHAFSLGDDNTTIKGSGVSKEVTRNLPDFRSLDVSSSFEVAVTISPKQSVTLNLDDNLLPFVETEVVADVLIVRLTEGRKYEWASPQRLAIVVPKLDSIKARGASKVHAKVGAETKSLRIEAEGAGFVRVTGLTFTSIDVKARDVGRVELSGRVNR